MLYRLPDVPGNPIVELVEDVSHHPRHSGLVHQVVNTDLYDIEDQRSPLSPIPEKWEEGGSCLEFQPWHCWLLENGHAIYDWYAVKIVQDPQGQEVVEYKERPTPLAFIAKSPLVDQQREYIEPFFECDFSRIASVGNPMVRLPVSARASLAVSLRNRLAGCQKEANQELNKVIQRIDEEEDFDEDGVGLYRIQPPRLNQPVAVDPRTSTLKVGWISPKGNFYAVPYEGHDQWEYQVVREKYFGDFQRGLRNAGWAVLSVNNLIKGERSLTQKQLDTLFDLGVTKKDVEWYEHKLFD